MLSVVIPMYKTAASLPELIARLSAVVPSGSEIVLVDDACPDESWSAALTLATAGLALTVVRLTKNVGQFAAVQVGMSRATGDMIAIMDADLQDPPESLPLLVAELGASPSAEVVCSVRAGKYESWFRRWTARLYRRSATVLSRGRIPLNAGMFLVARRGIVDEFLHLNDPFIPVVPGLARAGATMRGLEVHRQPRLIGRSSYSFRGRLTLAARGLATLSPAHPVLAWANRARWSRIDSHVIVVR